MSSWSVSFIAMVNSSILNSYMQNLDLYVVPLHHLAAISKNSWAKRLGLASVLTGVLYSHVKYCQRAPFLVLTLFKAEVKYHNAVRTKPPHQFQDMEYFQTELWGNSSVQKRDLHSSFPGPSQEDDSSQSFLAPICGLSTSCSPSLLKTPSLWFCLAIIQTSSNISPWIQ